MSHYDGLLVYMTMKGMRKVHLKLGVGGPLKEGSFGNIGHGARPVILCNGPRPHRVSAAFLPLATPFSVQNLNSDSNALPVNFYPLLFSAQNHPSTALIFRSSPHLRWQGAPHSEGFLLINEVDASLRFRAL